MKVIKPSIYMKSGPKKSSKLETECLFGESLEILDEHTDWYFCRLLTDNYIGWVQKRQLGEMLEASHRVISKRTFLFKRNHIKSGCIDHLPLGAQVCVNDIDKKWTQICLFKNSNYKYAFIPTNHLIKIGEKIDNWVDIAEKMIGTPYLWGGRNSIGMDCSALLQLSYQTYGESIPRNSVDQSLLKKEIVKDKNFLKRGFVVFWKGHVGIMTDKKNCIHANAFHMEVSKELLDDIISRTEKNNPIIKMMNFN